MDHSIFLQLVRLGVGHDGGTIKGAIQWSEVLTLAREQGLTAIVFDGVDRLIQEGRLPAGWEMDDATKTKLIGTVVKGYEQRYKFYCKVIAEMAGFYNSRGYKMMVLKGYASSLDYPKPDHRPTGDIDIWQFGKYKECDAAVETEKGIEVDNTHHHHTVFHWCGFMVENHYDFINVHSNRMNSELEKIFKNLGSDDTYFTDVLGERVYLPSPNMGVLFLLRHSLAHFAAEHMSIRQILDYGFFVKKYASEIGWQWLEEVLERFNMKKFYDCINRICVDDLGFDASLFPVADFDSDLKNRVLADVLCPEFSGEMPKGFLSRIVFKFRRWQANAWKQKLCYNENRFIAFWVAVWSHLLKPSSI